MGEFKLSSIEDAIKDFKEGKFVIVVDDEDRENEGDLIIAAEKITAEKVNFMLKHARGVLCAPITLSRADELDLPHQVEENTSMLGTPFTITIDKLEGCTTGVSASDRAETIKALADPTSTPQTFGRPGHINPLYAQENGVLRRCGHTEAAVDLCKISGLYPAGALMEIMSEDGTMARMPELIEKAKEWDLKIITIKDLIAYRLKTESTIEVGEEVEMPTQYGHFHLIPFRQNHTPISAHNEKEHQKTSPYRFAYFVLTDEREKLYRRIDQRVDLMMEQGLLTEVKTLYDMGCRKDMVSMQGLGYKEILDYLDGSCSLEEAVYVIKRETRHFAKRQLTWFRREKDVIWLDKSEFNDREDQMLQKMTDVLHEKGIIQ
jgi:3,4-dihydroxy 2-butanone 4-phosphate synthase/GTP cyclohydrolase II